MQNLLQEEKLVTSTDGDFGHTLVYNQYARLSIRQQRERLPIFKRRNHLLYLLETHRTIILVGETGCGKSTQVPQYLLEAGWADGGRKILATQPRRVAVVTVSARVAEERGVQLGMEVGYAIRFDECCSPSTRLRFVTDGVLLRELMSDPLLTAYSVVLVDEVHERTVHTDVLLGLLRKVQRKRPDLRLIVASATADCVNLKRYFETDAESLSKFDATSGTGTNVNPAQRNALQKAIEKIAAKTSTSATLSECAVLFVEGRQFPIEVFYASQPVANYVDRAVEVAWNIHQVGPSGDILVFLTGQNEVEQAVALLVERYRGAVDSVGKLKVLAFYASLPHSDQMRVFERLPRAVRKLVVATNIAEASITVPNVVYVVDCGFVKLRTVDAQSGVEALCTVAESRASAAQRAGRAGRVRPGRAYRLFTEDAFDQLPQFTPPEIQRTDVSHVLLQLKALGIDNVLKFHFPSPPPAENVAQALELLYALGAIDGETRLTIPLGERMAELALHPSQSRMLLAAADFGCVDEICAIVAMMQIQNAFIEPRGQRLAAERARRRFAVKEGDHLTALNVFLAFERAGRNASWCGTNMVNYRGLCRAAEIRDQLRRNLLAFGIRPSSLRAESGVSRPDTASTERVGDLIVNEAASDAIRKCIILGYFANACELHFTGEYHTLRNQMALGVHPSCILYQLERLPRYVIYTDVVHSASKLQLRECTALEPQWLYELVPSFYEFGTEREIAERRLNDPVSH